jgi:tRNA(Ile)-lysidine synthase TilS/MesJ
LAEARERLVPFTLIAATFEDFDAQRSPTFSQAIALAKDLGVEHHLIPTRLVEDAFGLNKPLRRIMPELMATRHAPSAMYVDHHTTRRGLELFAEKVGASRIAIGLHTTDLLAGLLNGITTGYRVGNLPLRRIGEIEYIYPLCFVAKRELHLFHRAKRGFLARHSEANPWERKPLDRNFYYYLADVLQDYWPGIEAFVFNSHNLRNSREGPILAETCEGCGATLLLQPFMPVTESECEVCQVLRDNGYKK